MNVNIPEVPVNVRNAGERSVRELPTKPAHEALRTHWLQNEGHLKEQFLAKRWPRRYYKHPVYTAAAPGEFVWPYAIYLDGVRFTREDTVLGVWVQCLITGKRWLIMILRKTEYCNCGCRGYCSLRPFWAELAWSMRSLARGKYLSFGPDGSQLSEDRLAFADEPLGFRAACIFIKGDWMEFSSTLCFPTWTSTAHPCVMCDATLALAYMLLGLSVLELPWARRLIDWYDAACQACEIWVVLTDEAYRKVRASLFYDNRPKGSRGRALALDLPEVGPGLRAGDRLEPCSEVPDVGEGFDRGNPGSALFWRIPERPAVHHRLPIFDAALGTGPDSLVVDGLHAGSHGAYKQCCTEFTWECFEANCWGAHDSSAEGRLAINADRLRGDLFAWYGDEHRAGRKHAEVQALTHHMLGSAGSHDLKLHAAEMNGYLHFCCSLVERFQQKLPRAALWRKALQSFAAMDTMTHENPEVFDDDQCQTFVTLAVGGLGALQDLGVEPKPKCHAIAHMAGDVYEKGSPALWATWVDEGLNKMLKDVGSGTNRNGWYERTLFNANFVLDRLADRKAKKARAR